MFAKSEIAFGLLLLAPCVAVTSVQAQQSAADVLIQRARTLDGQGRHDLAAAAWRQVLLVNPTEPDALASLASYYQSTGDSVKADHYRSLLRSVKPGDPRLAQIPVTHVPAGGSADFELAARLASQHHYQEALTAYRKAFHGATPFGTYAVSYYETQAAVPAELPQAISGLRDLYKQYPANPTYQLALGRVLTYDARTRVEGIKLLAGLHGTAEQKEQARSAWKQAILWSPNGPAAETAPEYLARYPDEQLAARVHGAQPARPARTAVPGEVEQGAAYAALAKGDLQQALHLFEPLLAIPGQRGKALAGMGYVNMQQQEFAAAADHFEQAEAAGFHPAELTASLVDARYYRAMQQGNHALESEQFTQALSAFDLAHSIKPNGPEAVQGQAGVLMQQNRPDKALPLFEQAVRMQQDRPQGWIAWFDALVQSNHSKEVIADQPYITPETAVKLEADPTYTAVIAAAQMNVGNEGEGKRLLAQLAEMPQQDKRTAAQLRCAQLIALNNPRGSARLAFDVIRISPDNVEAWKLLIRDEHAAGRDQMALTAADRMPSTVYQEATRDVDFVVMLADTHQAMKQYSTASNLLAQAKSETQGDSKKANRVETQNASLLLAEGSADNAYKTYIKILKRSPLDSDAWKGVIASLHQANQDQAALTQVQQLPVEAAQALDQDLGYLQTLASVYSGTGHNQLALETMSRVLAHYQPGTNDAPYAVESQYAWLLLNAGDEGRLATTLAELGRRSDLTPGQKQQTGDLWAAWSVRKADREEKAGNNKQALAILEMASQAYPASGEIRRATAGYYIRNGEGKRAFALYEEINWAKATATDYSGAVTAAASAHQKEAGRQWLLDGLQQFPNDPQLLTAAAQFEESTGDNHMAAVYWRKVVANSSQIKLTQQLSSNGNTLAPSAVSAGDALARMLAPQDSFAPPAPAAPPASESLQDAISAMPVTQHPSSEDATETNEQPSPWLVRKNPPPAATTRPIAFHPPQTSRWTVPLNDGPPPPAAYQQSAAEQPQDAQADTQDDSSRTVNTPTVTNASLTVYAPVARGTEYAPEASMTTAPGSTGAPQARPVMLGPAMQAQAELDGLASRYSAWMGGETQLGSRSGQAGFDQLTRMEANFETSTVLGETARLTIRAMPVLLSAGAPDGTSNYNFGTSGAPLIGQSHYQSGVGAEVQLATRLVDGSVGFSPSTFYVSHLLGNFAVHPSNFPLTFRAYREQVKETMLSYAGEKDPVTGKIWGGVVATGAEGTLNLGDAREGFYVSGGGAQLTGTNVNNNSRISGSTGAYWTIYSNPFGVFKMGANLTGLHYAQNQRYFTYGQGGYFSPNSYVLLNAPFSWEAHALNHFVYTLKGSLGVQSFYEGTALPGSLVETDTVPTAQSNLAANYNLDANLAYRFDEHWYISGFVGVNNAHDYQDRTAGISVKYMQRPQVDVEGGPTGLFDEHKVRPLIVP